METKPDEVVSTSSDTVASVQYAHIPETRPIVKGQVNGNVYAVIGAANRALKRVGLDEAAQEMRERTMFGSCSSYDEVLGVVQEYVEFELKEIEEDDTN